MRLPNSTPTPYTPVKNSQLDQPYILSHHVPVIPKSSMMDDAERWISEDIEHLSAHLSKNKTMTRLSLMLQDTQEFCASRLITTFSLVVCAPMMGVLYWYF